MTGHSAVAIIAALLLAGTAAAAYAQLAVSANDAKVKLEAHMQGEMSKITGGLPLPPGLKLPF